MNKTTTKEALALGEAMLKRAKLSIEPFEASSSSGFKFTFPDKGPAVTGQLFIIGNEERAVLFLSFDKDVPIKHRDRVARFLTRANYGMSIGNFEMNLDDGDVRFRAGLDYQGIELTEQLLRSLLVAAMNAVEAYANAFAKVASGKLDADQAIEAAESGMDL